MMDIRPPHADHEPMMEINTTPLIDVMLVLLVMLIITIPTAWQSTELSIKAGTSESTPAPTPTLQIRVNAQGHWLWNGTLLTEREQLIDKLRTAAQQRPVPALELQSDPKAPYAQVLTVLANAQQLGLTQLGVKP